MEKDLTKTTKEEFMEKYSIQEIIDIYFLFNDNEINEKYNLSHPNIRKIKKELNIVRPKVKTLNSTVAIDNLQKVINKVNKKDLLKFYVYENNTFEDTYKHFDISRALFVKLLKHYNIKKPTSKAQENIDKTKLEKYGSKTYNNSEQIRKTNLERYGVDNQFKRKEMIEDSMLKKYGVKYIAQLPEVSSKATSKRDFKVEQEKIQKTNMERYGVPNVSLIPEVKEKIKESVIKTFQEKYGVDNYWEKEDAKRSNGSKNSRANINFKKLLEDNKIEYIQEFNLKGKWFDFKVGNILIEINPTPTHNTLWTPWNKDKGIDINYHLEKTILAKENEYRCIHIWDWDDLEKIVSLLKPRETIYARKCEVKEIEVKDTIKFLNEHHLQNSAKSSIAFGLFYENELVSVMTFGKPRYNKNHEYELIRYCSSKNIVGGEKRLYSAFLLQYKPSSVISYCDNAKFDGTTYNILEFKLYKKGVATRHWYSIKTNKHITESLLRQQGFDRLFNTDYGKGTSNTDLMIINEFLSVYDCGQSVYVWKEQKDN